MCCKRGESPSLGRRGDSPLFVELWILNKKYKRRPKSLIGGILRGEES
jgi:hypothetical protein